jgi:hypothetical protein
VRTGVWPTNAPTWIAVPRASIAPRNSPNDSNGHSAPALVEDDLGQRLSGDVGAGGVVHHPNLLAAPDPLRQLVERDVTALFGVVKLPALVSLDQAHHFGHPSALGCNAAVRQSRTIYTAVRQSGQALCRGAASDASASRFDRVPAAARGIGAVRNR